MIPEYSRCPLGRRCIVKTDDSYFYRKFTLLCAVNNSKCVGWKLYEQGGMTKERLVEFLKENVFINLYDKILAWTYLSILGKDLEHKHKEHQ